MRKYAALYNHDRNSYAVIFQDDYDGYWSVYQDNLQDMAVAKEIAEALNKVKEDQR
jgi:hypothetical protein